MKLAVLTCGMLPIPAVQGGAVENLIDFYLEYNNQKRLHDITIYSPWHAKVQTHAALSSGVNHYHYINVTNTLARIERKISGYFHSSEDYYNYYIEYYFEKVYSCLKKENYDYILLENCPGFAYKLSKRGYKKIILHLHNDLLHSKSRYHDVIFNSLTKILTVSDYVKKRVSSIQPDIKVQTVYNGIDLTQFSPKEESSVTRGKVGLADDDFVMVYSGRINRDKGISELIDAMLQLEGFSKVKLLVLGSSFFDNAKNEDAFIRSLRDRANDIAERIIFTGFIPYSQVSGYLRLADIAVLPSMWEEPFGLTIVEAMAVGLPLITTRSGGIPEICEGIASIVDREDIVRNLSAAILDLYEHPEKREQMATAGLERARLFDKNTYAEKFFSALENL